MYREVEARACLTHHSAKIQARGSQPHQSTVPSPGQYGTTGQLGPFTHGHQNFTGHEKAKVKSGNRTDKALLIQDLSQALMASGTTALGT